MISLNCSRDQNILDVFSPLPFSSFLMQFLLLVGEARLTFHSIVYAVTKYGIHGRSLTSVSSASPATISLPLNISINS